MKDNARAYGMKTKPQSVINRETLEAMRDKMDEAAIIPPSKLPPTSSRGKMYTSAFLIHKVHEALERDVGRMNDAQAEVGLDNFEDAFPNLKAFFDHLLDGGEL